MLTRVLIVDDAAFMRVTLKKMLEKNGFEVVGEAENGEVALEKYELLNPDIVTMDITMPVLSGLEAVKKIVEKAPGAKVVMVSAMGQESYIREAVVSGAKSFIVKPFNEEHVIKTLNQVLGK